MTHTENTNLVELSGILIQDPQPKPVRPGHLDFHFEITLEGRTRVPIVVWGPQHRGTCETLGRGSEVRVHGSFFRTHCLPDRTRHKRLEVHASRVEAVTVRHLPPRLYRGSCPRCTAGLPEWINRVHLTGKLTGYPLLQPTGPTTARLHFTVLVGVVHPVPVVVEEPADLEACKGLGRGSKVRLEGFLTHALHLPDGTPSPHLLVHATAVQILTVHHRRPDLYIRDCPICHDTLPPSQIL